MHASLITIYTVNSKAVDNQSLFRQVVILDYWRILSRLRSKHAKITRKTTRKTRAKPAPTKLLSEIIKLIRAGGEVTQQKLDEIRAKVDNLNTLYDEFENIGEHSAESSAVQRTLLDLIKQTYELALVPELQDALQSSQIDTALKRSLSGAVKKVGRYYGTSLKLVAAARRKGYKIFNHIAVEVVQLQGLTKAPDLSIEFTLLNAVQNAIRPSGSLEQEATGRSIETYLQKPLAQIQREYGTTIIRTKHLKVHAEIQLLFYYEMHPDHRMIPKVICSSKSACYLCDLFIRLHGKFIMPRTHGRIYEKWILPYSIQGISMERRRTLGDVIKQFNDALESKIKLTLSSCRTLYDFPNESVSMPPNLFSSSTNGTIRRPSPRPVVIGSTNYPSEIKIVSPEQCFEALSVSSRSKEIFAKNSNETIHTSSVRTKGESSTTSILPEMVSHSTCPLTDTNDILLDGNILKDQLSKDSSIITVQQHPPERFSSACEPLVQGRSLRKQLVHPIQVLRVSTGSMHLDLSKEDAASDDVAVSKGCWVEVEWLSAYEQSRTSVDKVIFDIRNMASGSPITTYHGGALATTNLYLQLEQVLLSVKFGFET